jgi:meso-butanediol dehydrogenase/(S,S)-butanediol dehydrogenase/diacetyl reductase
MTGELAAKVALISGAAAGIGEAVTRRFAEAGATLWVNDIRRDPLGALVASVADEGTDITGMAGDASDPSFVDAWVAAAVEAHGRVDVLYNNVGMSRPGLIGDLTDEDWRFQQRMTLDTAFFATRAVIPHMVRQGHGTIVSMSSGAGIGGNYGLGAYGAAKAGVINLMETVATEYSLFGIRANAVTPGPTATAPHAGVGRVAARRRRRPRRRSRPRPPQPAGGGGQHRAVAGFRPVVEHHRDVHSQQHPGCQPAAAPRLSRAARPLRLGGGWRGGRRRGRRRRLPLPAYVAQGGLVDDRHRRGGAAVDHGGH